MYNHNKAQQSKNRVHISWDILYYKTDIGNNWGYIDGNGNWVGAIKLVMYGVSAGAGNIITMTS